MSHLILLLLWVSFVSASSIDKGGTIAADEIWNVDTVNIIDDVIINDGVTVTINPGTEVIFRGHYYCYVSGRVLAEGTAGDSILFIAADAVAGWQGLRFDGTPLTNDSSIFSFSRFEYGKASNVGGNYTNGGAFYISEFSKIRISDCVIRNCMARSNGGGIYLDSSSISIINCTFLNDSSGYGGGGIYCQDTSSPVIENCNITDSKSQYGGAIYCKDASSPVITNCIFTGDSAHYGGVIFSVGTSSLSIDSCTISNNIAMRGSVIYCSASSPSIANSTMSSDSANRGGVIYCTYQSAPSISGCTFSGSRAGVEGGVLFCTRESSPSLDNCDFLNTVSNRGGAIFCTDTSSPVITDCQFTNDSAYTGGAVYCSYASNPELTNCTVTNCKASYGGSFYLIRHASPVLNGCTISGSKSNYSGGAMYCDSSSPQIQNSTITECSAGGDGGGVHCRQASSPKITNSTITKCSAFGSGGGIYCIYFSSPEILSCNIIDNAVDGWGAGISCLYGSKPKIINCLIRGNNNVSGGAGGAGIYCRNSSSAAIISCMITGNRSASNAGGGVYCADTSSPDITNCTIANNKAGNDQGGGIQCTNLSSPKIVNTILWGNYVSTGLNQIHLASSTCQPSITWSDVQGGETAITGDGGAATWADNIDQFPDFTDSASGNFGLEFGSPCINTGKEDTTGLSLPALDVSGNARISEARIDMGADEYNVFEVSGDITSDTTWNADVVSVTGHVSVFNGVTLTIPAGAYIEFKGHFKLTINGRLLAEGTAQDSIIFTAENTTTGWYGIRFSNTAATNDSSKLSYCRMEYGKATGTGNDANGGAMFVSGFSKLSITHCNINNNYAANSGGGIYCSDASPSIKNSQFVNNTAVNSAAGIACITFSSPIIQNCLIRGNACTHATFSQGGGINISSQSSPEITNCAITNNQAIQGVGIYINSLTTFSSPSISNCTIVNNRSASTTRYGSGIGCFNQSDPVITNTIVWGNKHGSSDTSSQIHFCETDNSRPPQIIYSDVQGGQQYGISILTSDVLEYVYLNCINIYPAFTDSSAGNYNIPRTSPCVNKGTPDISGLNLPSVDLEGYARVLGDTIDIGALEYHNQMPTLVSPIADVSVEEDAPDSIHADLNDIFNDFEDGSSLTFSALSKRPTRVSVSINSDSALVLHFVENASSDADVIVKAEDSNGGSVSDTFNVAIAQVNDTPAVVSTIADLEVNEDAPDTAHADLDRVFFDPEDYTNLDYTVVSGDPSLVTATINTEDSLVLSFAANTFGTTSITVTATEKPVNGLSGSDTFTVTVNSVNDAPSIAAIADPAAILEDAALQTIPFSGIGNPETDQTITVTATSANTALIPHPGVTYTSGDATGSLSYTPAANANGSAVITVRVEDNGGIANGGVNFAETSFTVNVTGVNDAPTITAIANPAAIPEDAPLQTIPLAGISDGDPEASQTITVTAASSNTALIPHPAVTYTSGQATGSLSYTPVANASGSSVITVRVEDNGGTSNGGVNFTVTTFTVSVTPVNDAPVIATPVMDTTVLAGIQMRRNLSANDIDAGDVLAWSLVTPPAGMAIGTATGEILWTPTAAQAGSHLITARVDDAANAFDTAMFTITVDIQTDITVDNPVNTMAGDVFIAAPNPVMYPDQNILFYFQTKTRVQGKLMIYDAVGNLVYTKECTINPCRASDRKTEFADWNLITRTGRRASGGSYLALLSVIREGVREFYKVTLGVKE